MNAHTTLSMIRIRQCKGSKLMLAVLSPSHRPPLSMERISCTFRKTLTQPGSSLQILHGHFVPPTWSDGAAGSPAGRRHPTLVHMRSQLGTFVLLAVFPLTPSNSSSESCGYWLSSCPAMLIAKRSSTKHGPFSSAKPAKVRFSPSLTCHTLCQGATGAASP